MNYHYVWLIWSSAFLLTWMLLYALFPQHRVAMWRTSLCMAPVGLTQAMFVPEYWNPPSLFELAARTGFDIESLDLQLPALRPSARGTKQVEASRSAVDGQRHVRGIPCD